MKVLYVEDSPDVCAMVRNVLGKEGIEMECVGSLNEAMSKLACSCYDVLLVDLILPDAQGVEAVEALKPFGLPMIVVSGISDPVILERAALAGAEDYLLKPGLSGKTLIERVRFVHSRYITRMRANEAAAKSGGRKRMHGSTFEAIKPFITCSRAPFAAA